MDPQALLLLFLSNPYSTSTEPFIDEAKQDRVVSCFTDDCQSKPWSDIVSTG